MQRNVSFYATATALALLLCACAPPSYGEVETLTLIETPAPEDQEAVLGEMRQEMQGIQRKLGELESRLQALEAQGGPPAGEVAPPAPPPSVPDLNQWRQLKEGMSMDDVRNLLGAPGEIDREEYNVYWYYPDRDENSGKVDFGDDSTVLSWREPQE